MLVKSECGTECMYSIPSIYTELVHMFMLLGTQTLTRREQHPFSVIKSAENGSTYNFDNPVRRDVSSSGEEGQQVVLRFVADNAGPWVFHW